MGRRYPDIEARTLATWASRTPRQRVAGRLFQARMWREYAQAWDGRPTTIGRGVGREWVEKILCRSKAQCIKAARVNLYLARRAQRLVQP